MSPPIVQYGFDSIVSKGWMQPDDDLGHVIEIFDFVV